MRNELLGPFVYTPYAAIQHCSCHRFSSRCSRLTKGITTLSGGQADRVYQLHGRDEFVTLSQGMEILVKGESALIHVVHRCPKDYMSKSALLSKPAS